MEHRYSRRVSAGIELTIYKRGEAVAIGYLRDVSRMGLFIETDYSEAPIHQPLEIELLLHDNSRRENCRFRAIVARREGNGLGLELDENSMVGYRALSDLVASYGNSARGVHRPALAR